MQSELIQLKFQKIMQTQSYTCIVLGSEGKNFAIYTDIPSGKALKEMVTKSKFVRPMTHNLISMICEGLEIQIRQVVIHDLQETTYFARLFLEQKRGDILHIVEIDARPSDCITMALAQKAPIYCTPSVLEKVVAVVEE